MDILQEINKGIELTKNGKLSQAEKIYKNILKKDAENFPALCCIGLLYLDKYELKKSEKFLLKAYRLKSAQTVIEGLAVLYYNMGKKEEADKYFNEICDKTENIQVQEKYVNNLLKLSQFHKAYNYAEKLYKKYPFSKEIIVAYAKTCLYTGRFSQTDKILKTAVKQFPKYGEVWGTLGVLYEMFYKDNEKAKECFKKELRYGDKYDAYFNLTINSEKLGDYKRALYYLNKLSEYVGKHDHTTAFIRASLYFKQRKFKQGLKYYLYRGWSNNKYTHKLTKLWKGGNYKNETLFVLGDKGIGDIIMYSRYLPFLSKKFKKIKVYIRPDVRKTVERFCEGYKNIIFTEKTKRYPKCDKSVHLSDLPFYLKMSYEKIPFSGGYLTENYEKNNKYKSYFNDKNYKIGLCWEAGTVGFRDLIHRTLNISLFEQIFSLKNTKIYSLQVNPTMDNYKNYKGLIDLGSTFEDTDDTIEVISNLDLVITVDTSVAHIAGALGKETFLILPYCSDWRWFDNDNKTEWYDSIKIFKQTNPKNWDDVFEKIYTEIKTRL